MADTVTGKKNLVVLLGGIIGYVPEGKNLWALMPNARLPMPAQWRPMSNLMAARSPHFPYLRVDARLIDEDETEGDIDAFFRNGRARVDEGPLATQTTPEVAAILLLGEQLEFHVPPGELMVSPEIDRYFPQMSEISPKHQYVDRRFHPGSGEFNRRKPPISAAFQMKAGRLEVADYFGTEFQRFKVDFGFVSSSCFGRPRYHGQVWGRELANKLRWTVPLYDSQDRVVISSTTWKDGKDSYDYVFKIPANGTLVIEIMHTEPEIPSLFLDDPIPAEGIIPIPDPDFEVLYSLSSRPGKMRVPVPRKGVPSGSETKPCAGGYYKGFR